MDNYSDESGDDLSIFQNGGTCYGRNILDELSKLERVDYSKLEERVEEWLKSAPNGGNMPVVRLDVFKNGNNDVTYDCKMRLRRELTSIPITSRNSGKQDDGFDRPVTIVLEQEFSYVPYEKPLIGEPKGVIIPEGAINIYDR